MQVIYDLICVRHINLLVTVAPIEHSKVHFHLQKSQNVK